MLHVKQCPPITTGIAVHTVQRRPQNSQSLVIEWGGVCGWQA